ncbi:MAG: M48 family metalloprotease [Candidatus Brocadiaceae bacterium]|jgi:heat shock protein HtpX
MGERQNSSPANESRGSRRRKGAVPWRLLFWVVVPGVFVLAVFGARTLRAPVDEHRVEAAQQRVAKVRPVLRRLEGELAESKQSLMQLIRRLRREGSLPEELQGMGWRAVSRALGFAVLLLMAPAAVPLWLLQRARDRAREQQEEGAYAHWFWLLVLGSNRRFLLLAGALLLYLLYAGAVCAWAVSPAVRLAPLLGGLDSAVSAFVRNGLPGFRVASLVAVGVWTALLFVSWWVAGDVLGGIGGPVTGRRSFFSEQSRNRRRTWVLLAMSAVMFAVVGGAVALSWVCAYAWVADWVAQLTDQTHAGPLQSVTRSWAATGWTPMFYGAACLAALWFAACPLLLCYGHMALLALVGARKPTPEELRRLENVVEEMQIASGTPHLRWRVLPWASPNAFAFGSRRRTRGICVTSGLLNLLNRQELQAVVAHEVAHIRHRDTLFVSLALMTIYLLLFVTTVGVVQLSIALMFCAVGVGLGLLVWWVGSVLPHWLPAVIAMLFGFALALAFILLALPLLAASLVGLSIVAAGLLTAKFLSSGISQRREYAADAEAVQLTRAVEPMISALEKLGAQTSSTSLRKALLAPLYAIPVQSEGRLLSSLLRFLFSSHPPLERRIQRLRHMVRGLGRGAEEADRAGANGWPRA